jgi:hypothetical protein
MYWSLSSQAKIQSQISKDIFTDVTTEAGITWKQFNGESPDRFLIEAMGGGVAFLDFDGDGLLDILFINGGETPRGKSQTPVRNALYRNLGKGQFEDVAVKAGVDRLAFYGMGAAVGDFDNDGFPDLYITGYPASALFHNNRNGTFSEISEQAGVKNTGRWAASAAWFDYDRDGFLDLVVSNYVRFSFSDLKQCEYNGVRTYCEQKAYAGMPLTLYHNNGDGTFTDVSAASGLQKLEGRALGVVSLDVNNDGWPDLFVARDASPNLLLVNKHDRTFRDLALDAEVAYNLDGNAKAGMGVDVGDVNGDGWPDFVVTNFNDEYHSLLLSNHGALPYDDWTVRSHLASYTRKLVGWGAHFIDYDNDGSLDLMIVNGQGNSWIGFELVGTKSNRDAVGAKLRLHAGNDELVRWIAGGSSYLSSHDRRVVFGLGNGPPRHVDDLEITWPSGVVQHLSGLEPNRYHRIVQPDLR